jgi:tRNA threonylcarbamoyladenosine biosynthesis protein TsaB
MYSLVIDTATKYLYIALVNDENILEEIVIEGSKNHAGNSVYMLNELLNKHNLTIDDISNVYCGEGPGSYTGLRISVTIAKMIAAFKEVKLYAISSLYLAGSGYDNLNVAVLFDARRGNSFSACYGQNLIEDKLRVTNEFLETVKDFSDLKIVYENDFKVNPLKVIKNAKEVSEVDGFIPKYLRITEAEYNLVNKND